MISCRYFVVCTARSKRLSCILFNRRVDNFGCGNEDSVDCVPLEGVRVLMWWKEGMRFSRRTFVSSVV